MGLLKFKHKNETERLKELINEVEKNSFIVKKKTKNLIDGGIQVENYKAIKLSELNLILKKYF